MVILLTIIHVIVCVFLIIVVLLQSGKAADLAGAFGGMGSQTTFGPRGSATVLSKATTIAAAVFMLTSLTLSIYATRSAGVGSTVLENAPAPAQSQQTPAPGKQQAPTGSPQIKFSTPDGKSRTVPIPVQPAPGTPQQQAPAPAPAKK